MIQTCVQCGKEFEARRADILLCGDECRRERQKARAKAHNAAHPERVRARVKIWRKAHPERFRAQAQAWRAANRERLNAQNKVYREKNAERLRMQRKERRRLQKLHSVQTAAPVGDGDDR
jgi:hypothetical protein